MFEKCQHYRFFDIFWDTLNKMKDNLDQECVKGGLLSFQGKIETIASDFPGKMTVFSSFDSTFHLSLPKIWLSHPNPNKTYIFEMSNNRAIP